MKKTILTMALMGCMLCTQAQKVTCYTTTEGEAWHPIYFWKNCSWKFDLLYSNFFINLLL